MKKRRGNGGKVRVVRREGKKKRMSRSRKG
jgi:hypothetical protein